MPLPPSPRRRLLPSLAMVAIALLLAACSNGGGDGEVTATRATTSTTALDTTTSAPVTSVAEEPVPAEPEPEDESVVTGEENPVLAGAPRPVRASNATGPRRAASTKVQPTGHIDIPAIGLSHPTYEGIDLSIINHGPGHWPDTAHPGHRGNTVFPGHRTTYSRPFWDIDKLVAGDEVIFTTPAGRFTYRVTETFVVPADAMWIVNQTPEATFTIFACHPKGSARQRYVAKGTLVSPPAPAPPPQGEAKPGPGAGQPTTTTTTTSTTTTTAPPRRGIVPVLP